MCHFILLETSVYHHCEDDSGTAVPAGSCPTSKLPDSSLSELLGVLLITNETRIV